MEEQVQMEHAPDMPVELGESLPAMVRNELARLSAEQRAAFVEEYRRRMKSVGLTYLFWLLGWHYAYLGKWGLQALFWLTGGAFFVWWVVDLFRIPGLVQDHNKDVAVATLRDLKLTSS